MIDPFLRLARSQGLNLPPALAAFHAGKRQAIWQGEAVITRGHGLHARLALWLAGFPPEGQRIATTLTLTQTGENSIWHRDFGGHVTRSTLAAKPPHVIERFGPICLTLALREEAGSLCLDIAGMRLFGLPVPRVLLPISATRESDLGEGCLGFDVAARLPWGAPLIRYTGWLKRVDRP